MAIHRGKTILQRYYCMVKLREVIVYIFAITLLIASYFYVSSRQQGRGPASAAVSPKR